jgi:heme-degrading monooxygenase HmoA
VSWVATTNCRPADTRPLIATPPLWEDDEVDGGAVETLPLPRRRQIMYARTSTIEAQPSSIDAGTAHVRDTVMPALERMEGFTGLSLLVDRSSGRCIATTAWQSEEAIRASAEAVRPIRDRVAEILGGSPTVEEWEIAALHRDHQSREGACVRATWVKIDPDQVDRGIDFYKTTILPALEDLEGFCSASLLVERASGRGVSSATYDSVEALERNKEQLDRLRATGTEEVHAEVLEERDFELAVAHLRVPEMA